MYQFASLYLILIYCLTYNTLFAQSYTNYRAGNPNDTATAAQGGICLMGGVTEDDNAMRWFLNRVCGGDIVVLRTSGSDGYNNYFYSSFGVTINSVETFVCHDSTAAYDAYLGQRLQEAEAVWFAGGNRTFIKQ